MSQLIPNYSITAWQKLNTAQKRRLKSCELTSDGSYVCTMINPTTEYIRAEAENKGQLSNALGKETLEEIIGVVSANI